MAPAEDIEKLIITAVVEGEVKNNLLSGNIERAAEVANQKHPHTPFNLDSEDITQLKAITPAVSIGELVRELKAKKLLPDRD